MSAKRVKEPTTTEFKPVVAIVKNGKYEVRRYTQEEHGKDFTQLANDFAAKKSYQVELAELTIRKRCEPLTV